MLKRVLTRVDFPRPDSPRSECQPADHTVCFFKAVSPTNDHNVEVEALPYTLAVPLVRQVGESHVSCELPAHNVPHVCRGLCCCLGVFGAHGLRGGLAAVRHGVARRDHG